jgi:protease I
MKAIILTESLVQDEELLYPTYRLAEAGLEVDTAITNKNDKVYGKYGIPVRANKSFSELKVEDYDLLVIPGGWAPEKVRMNADAINFVREYYKTGKIISSICHGPWVLASAGIIKGKRVTGYIGIKDDLNNAGGIYVDNADVVQDGTIITSPHYRNNPIWMLTTLRAANMAS